MEFREYYANGDIGGGEISIPLPDFKARAITWAIDCAYPRNHPYRTIIIDRSFQPHESRNERIAWDTDEILGIWPKERVTGANGENLSKDVRMHHGDGDEALPVDSGFTVFDVPVNPDPHCTSFRGRRVMRSDSDESTKERIVNLDVAEQMADRYHSIRKRLAMMDDSCYARACDSMHNVMDALAISCAELGWPMDGAGQPLRSCRDEAGPLPS